MSMRKFILAALIAAPFLAACMPDTPETQLSWPANTKLVKTQGAAPVRSASAKPVVSAQSKSVKTAPVSRVASAPVSSQALAPVAPTPVATTINFAWPVSGRVVSDFGSTSNGGRNDGINIAAAEGAPIHASAAGTVTYAGDGLKGYGNLVLVKHADGYTTAYAHAQRLVVAKGDTVARGQVIGYVGQTGDVTSPQLHFEIRSNTKPLNPRSVLNSNTASN